MSYQVKYTETTNSAKQAITVEDQTLNSVTSLKFPGKNYAGYAPIIAENFLHLLENFAKNTAPSNPVQGQLWFDTTTSVNLLKVFDGTTWTPAGSVKKSASAPVVGNSSQGDLWVNTTTQQLYVFSGSNWLLIGPQFSSGLKTGPIVETIVGADDIEYSVLSLYAKNYRIAVVSKDAFTPKQSIEGFTKIEQGINLSKIDLSSSTAATKFWGVASTADSLRVAGQEISAANFLRSDQTNTINYGVNIRNDLGLAIGSDLSFSIGTDTTSHKTIFYSKTSGNSIQFQLNNAGAPTTAIHIDSNLRVGIGANNTNPAAALDVAGNIISDGKLVVLDTTDAVSATVVQTNAASIATAGGLTVNKKTILTGDVSTYGKIYVNNLDQSSEPTEGAVILPGSDSAASLYDIGSETRKFRTVYADTFVGNFTGVLSTDEIIQGSINGAAAKLSSPTDFSITGDVTSNTISFDGQNDSPAVFTTTISQDFISNKRVATINDIANGTQNSELTDQMLIFRPSIGLRKVTKSTFVSNIPTVPIGAIFAFAGSTVPNGYLLCDGSEVTIADYTLLYNTIGYTYKASHLLIGQSTFALPDLRGRFALGRDNMDNGNTVLAKNGGNLVNAGGGSANRVTDIAADTLGAGSGNEQRTIAVTNLPEHKHTLATNQADYFAIGRPGLTTDTNGVPSPGPTATSTGLSVPTTGNVIPPGTSNIGQPMVTMNPYQTINYIIFTGVLQ